MPKGRLEAFSDGVLAVIITIMVLEIHSPAGPDLGALGGTWPAVAEYALSFVYVGIYWNNHHHLLHASRRVGGRAMWANLHLLFWLSLVPLATGWIGKYPFAALPTAVYGGLLFLAGVAFVIFAQAMAALDPDNAALREAVTGSAAKGIASQLLYLAAVGLAFVRPWIAQVIYAGIAALWVIPDPRIERRLAAESAPTVD
jgi:uncharacterized membrane protein